MFSALPMPKVSWNEKNMRLLLPAFPLVGVMTGLLEALWICISIRLSFPVFLTAAVICAVPVLVTGGIHLDGYMDVSDALSSYGDAGKRREILSDPHIGAFAVIHIAVLMILYFGFASALPLRKGPILLFGCSFVVSRCLSGLAVSVLPLSKETGLARTFQDAADRRLSITLLGAELFAASVVMIVGGAVLGGGTCAAAAILMICCAAGQWLYLRRTAAKKFGGLSGDLNGWFLVKAELWMLGALVLVTII